MNSEIPEGSGPDDVRRGRDLLEEDSYEEDAVRRSMLSPSVYYIASGDTQRVAEEYIQQAMGSAMRDSLQRLADTIVIAASASALVTGVLLFGNDRVWAAFPGSAAAVMAVTSVIVRVRRPH